MCKLLCMLGHTKIRLVSMTIEVLVIIGRGLSQKSEQHTCKHSYGSQNPVSCGVSGL